MGLIGLEFECACTCGEDAYVMIGVPIGCAPGLLVTLDATFVFMNANIELIVGYLKICSSVRCCFSSGANALCNCAASKL
jgi:hypothetical protein